MVAAAVWAQDTIVYLGVVTAAVTTVGLVWVKVARPVVHFGARVERALAHVERELQNNGGKSIRDVADRTERHAAEAATRLERLEHLATRNERAIAQAAEKAEQATVLLAQHAGQEIDRYQRLEQLIKESHA